MITRQRKAARLMEEIRGWSPRTATFDILRAGKTLVARQAQALSPRRRTAFAGSLALRAVGRYWEEIQAQYQRKWQLPRFPAAVPRMTLDPRLEWLADSIGRAAAHAEPVTSGYFLGTTYAAALPPETRARFGVYYTPPAVATRLLDQVAAAGVDWGACSVLDPACGGGAFLAPVAQRIVKQLSHLEPDALVDTVASRVHGFEIDPVAAWMSQVFLEATLMPACRAVHRRLPCVVDVCDSLNDRIGDGRYDLVIGNPPYGRTTLRPALRARYAASLYGHANLYGVFTELALSWVRPGGLVAYVTPTSFLAGEYFKNLRRLLGDHAPPVAIDFITRRRGVFDNVLQEALLATYRRTGERQAISVYCATPVDDHILQLAPAGTASLPEATERPWLVPRTVAQASLISRLRRMPDRLVDWGYTVSTGPLVWNRHKSQLRRVAVAGALPLIWAESISPDGRFALRAAKTNHQAFFKPRPGDDWLITRRPCVIVQRTTAKEQSRRLIAAVLPAGLIAERGGVVVENHLNMLRSLEGTPAVPPTVLAAFLNSAVADQVFRCLSGSVAVSAYELEAMPLPPRRAVIGRLAEAVQNGATRETIEEICRDLYE